MHAWAEQRGKGVQAALFPLGFWSAPVSGFLQLFEEMGSRPRDGSEIVGLLMGALLDS